jgi:hypothetical protein
VTVEDAQGDVVANSTASITLSIATQPFFGSTLTCSGTGTNGDTFAAVNGVATMAGCQTADGFGISGTYTINAKSTGLTQATSSSFTS